MSEDERREKWEVGAGYAGFKVWVSREVDKIGKLTSTSKTIGRRFSILRRKRPDELDLDEPQDEFRAFLSGVKDNVELYLWFALSALIERSADRKFEGKVYHALGMVSSTFQSIGLNFDPKQVTPDLLDFLKDRMTRIASPGAFDIQGHASTINQGDGPNRFEESVKSFEKMLQDITWEVSKYYKKNEALETAAAEAMKNAR